MVPRLVLFDIDLTLIRSILKVGPGFAALEKAIRDLTGYEGEIAKPVPDGKTDPMIIRELFDLNGLEYKPGYYEKLMQIYLPLLEKRFKDGQAAEVLPGVRELLEELHRQDGFCLGLVTGNDERGAAIKLKPYGLDRFFPIGAYGSDSQERWRIIEIAIDRAQEHFGKRFLKEFTFIIGDSRRDIVAANKAGVRAIGVLTGHASREGLQDEGSCYVVDDLSDTQAILNLLNDRPDIQS